MPHHHLIDRYNPHHLLNIDVGHAEDDGSESGSSKPVIRAIPMHTFRRKKAPAEWQFTPFRRWLTCYKKTKAGFLPRSRVALIGWQS